MALSKKGSRAITVDGETYRWKIRRKPTYGQALSESGVLIAIQRRDGGRLLVVELSSPRQDNWLGLRGAVVTPRHVANFIRRGTADGWSSDEDGPPFVLRVEDAA